MVLRPDLIIPKEIRALCVLQHGSCGRCHRRGCWSGSVGDGARAWQWLPGSPPSALELKIESALRLSDCLGALAQRVVSKSGSRGRGCPDVHVLTRTCSFRGPRAASRPSWAHGRRSLAEHAAQCLSCAVANGVVHQVGPSGTAYGSSELVKAHTPRRGRPSCRNTSGRVELCQCATMGQKLRNVATRSFFLGIPGA